jgi:hypothetical protein
MKIEVQCRTIREVKKKFHLIKAHNLHKELIRDIPWRLTPKFNFKLGDWFSIQFPSPLRAIYQVFHIKGNTIFGKCFIVLEE